MLQVVHKKLNPKIHSLIFRIQLYLCISIGIISVNCQDSSAPLVTDKYYGTPLGPLLAGPATGFVFLADESTIFIRQFSFSGSTYSLAFFQAGSTTVPDGTGFLIPDDHGSTRPLENYNEKDIVLRLPEGRTIRDIRWLSVWSRQVHSSLGHVMVPVDVRPPRPLELPPLTGLAHGVRSGPITVVDAQTILITDFWYDGEGPTAYWWATRGTRQSPQGLRLKDENNSPKPMRAYRGESFLISLPDTKSIYDFDWLGVWCEQFQVDFGHVHLPQHIRVPPSPRMLGLRPETKLNCEVLDDARGFEVRWVIDGDDVVMQLVARLQPHEYMALGLGKDDSRSTMVDSDVAVAWIDVQGTGHVVDYYISSKEQCVGNRGSCPDLKHPGATDSLTLLHATVVNGFSMITFKRPQLGVDEIYDQHVYSDGQQAILWAIGPLNSRNEVSYHTIHSYGDRYLDFARTPSWNCPKPDQSLMNQRKWQHQLSASAATSVVQKLAKQPQAPNMKEHDAQMTKPESKPSMSVNESNSTDSTTPTPMTTPTTSSSTTTTTIAVNVTDSQQPKQSLVPWNIPKLRCPKDRTLWAQIGPVGGAQRGYRGITGRQGWGIAWYVNGLLVPEIVLQRGVTYTFVVEGGNDVRNGARRHPMYITNSAEGGFEYKTPNERRQERVFAGVGITSNGTVLPTAEGRLCEWKVTPATNLENIDSVYPRFEDFKQTLELECDKSGNAQPGVLRFTPDHNTPDLVYYQCYTHRYLGWKIHVVDHCEDGGTDLSNDRGLHSAASIVSTVKVAPPPPTQIKNEMSDSLAKARSKPNLSVQKPVPAHKPQRRPQPMMPNTLSPYLPIPHVGYPYPQPTMLPAPTAALSYGQHLPPNSLFGSRPYPNMYNRPLVGIPFAEQLLNKGNHGQQFGGMINHGHYMPQQYAMNGHPMTPMKKFGYPNPALSSQHPQQYGYRRQQQPQYGSVHEHQQPPPNHSRKPSNKVTFDSSKRIQNGFVPLIKPDPIQRSSNQSQTVWFPAKHSNSQHKASKPAKTNRLPGDIYRLSAMANETGSTSSTTEASMPSSVSTVLTTVPEPTTIGTKGVTVNSTTESTQTIAPPSLDQEENKQHDDDNDDRKSTLDHFTNVDATDDEMENAESQRTVYTLNGVEYQNSGTLDHKPLSIHSLMEQSERISVNRNNTDHTILSDVLRLIAQNVALQNAANSNEHKHQDKLSATTL